MCDWARQETCGYSRIQSQDHGLRKACVLWQCIHDISYTNKYVPSLRIKHCLEGEAITLFFLSTSVRPRALHGLYTELPDPIPLHQKNGEGLLTSQLKVMKDGGWLRGATLPSMHKALGQVSSTGKKSQRESIWRQCHWKSGDATHSFWNFSCVRSRRFSPLHSDSVIKSTNCSRGSHFKCGFTLHYLE